MRESWNKAACVHVLVRKRLTYYVCPHSRVSPVCVGFCEGVIYTRAQI